MAQQTSSLPPAEVAARIRQWREKTAEIEALKQRRQAASEKIKSRWTSSRRLLAKSQVGEGKSVPFAENKVSVQRGELLLLTVLPNGNHGADSTLVEWTIRETAGDQRTWSLADLDSQSAEEGTRGQINTKHDGAFLKRRPPPCS